MNTETRCDCGYTCERAKGMPCNLEPDQCALFHYQRCVACRRRSRSDASARQHAGDAPPLRSRTIGDRPALERSRKML